MSTENKPSATMPDVEKIARKAAKKKYGPSAVDNGFHDDWIKGYQDCFSQAREPRVTELAGRLCQLQEAITGAPSGTPGWLSTQGQLVAKAKEHRQAREPLVKAAKELLEVLGQDLDWKTLTAVQKLNAALTSTEEKK